MIEPIHTTPQSQAMPIKSGNSCEPPQKHWTLYLLECRSGAYYTGITNNIDRRYRAHLAGKGAKYTRANPPVRILGTCNFPDRSTASKAEYALRGRLRKRTAKYAKAAAAVVGA